MTKKVHFKIDLKYIIDIFVYLLIIEKILIILLGNFQARSNYSRSTYKSRLKKNSIDSARQKAGIIKQCDNFKSDNKR